jgi:amino acid adenylation domain-containing protein
VISPKLFREDHDLVVCYWQIRLTLVQKQVNIDGPLAQRNDTRRDYPRDQCIHHIFQRCAALTPDATALVFEDRLLSYGELNRRANQLAHHLRKEGVQPDDLVAICVRRSIEMIVGILAILKAGAAYVPIDPDQPFERQEFVLADTRAAVLLTQSFLAGRLPQDAVRLLYIDLDFDKTNIAPDENLPSEGSGSSLSNVIYTSGSTGKPKGVEVTHRGVLRLVLGSEYAQLDAERIFLQLAPISFDASTFEIWAPLLNGAKCVIYPDRVPTPGDFGEVLKRNKITTLWLTSSLYNLVIDQDPDSLNSLDELLIGGEALSVAHVRRGLELLPRTQIINGYGPTESTTFACCFNIPRPFPSDLTSVPIGRPIANTEVYILDEFLSPVAEGASGDLCIGGDGLARGYLNRSELTAEKFIQNPFNSDPRSRLYVTGDRARYLPDGNIEFLGRIDQQVKIRGYRIELGEIEAALGRHPRVRQAVVAVREATPGDKRLVAYVVEVPGQAANENLRTFLSKALPIYMVPGVYVTLGALPLTANGKIDRDALPSPFDERHSISQPERSNWTSIEGEIARIFESVLGLLGIDTEDSFFDLGGDSLAAVRVSAQIESSLGVSIPLATIFEAPTVKQLAAVLENGNFQPVSDPLIGLHPYGTKPPLFLLPGLGGHVYVFRELAKMLGSKQPVYGLQPRGLDGLQPPHRDIPEMAAYLIEAVRKVAPHGPYYFAGFSAGGNVAYEMSTQLRAAGEHVAMLCLLDSAGPRYPAIAPLRVRIWLHIKQLVSCKDWFEAGRLIRKGLAAVGKRLRPKKEALPIGLHTNDGSLSKTIEIVARAWKLALDCHVPQLYDGRVSIVRVEDKPQWLGINFDDPLMGWGTVAKGKVSLCQTKGSHLKMFSPDNLPSLTDLLLDEISEAHLVQGRAIRD